MVLVLELLNYSIHTILDFLRCTFEHIEIIFYHINIFSKVLMVLGWVQQCPALELLDCSIHAILNFYCVVLLNI